MADLCFLAPLFRKQVEAALDNCRARSLDAVVYETYRSLELAQLYYKRGRTIRPPDRPVTNAKTNLYSWHGYGLAVDVISKSERWFNPLGKPALKLLPAPHPDVRAYAAKGERWFREVAGVFKAHGMKWGGDWIQRDTPHFQWGRCKPSPSDRARELVKSGGLEAVWREVGAAA